jgi:hypothetical protein
MKAFGHKEDKISKQIFKLAHGGTSWCRYPALPLLDEDTG